MKRRTNAAVTRALTRVTWSVPTPVLSVIAPLTRSTSEPNGTLPPLNGAPFSVTLPVTVAVGVADGLTAAPAPAFDTTAGRLAASTTPAAAAIRALSSPRRPLRARAGPGPGSTGPA